MSRQRRVGGEVRVAVPAVTEPGGSLNRLRHTPADPPFHSVGREWSDLGAVDLPQVAVDGFASQQGLDGQDALFESGRPLVQIRPHGPELVGAAAEPGLDDERPRRHGGQRPDLLGHQHRVPQRDEEQAAHRTVGPFRQKATEHRHVLHVSSRAGGVVVAQGQAVEAGPMCGLGLAEDLERPLPLAARVRWC